MFQCIPGSGFRHAARATADIKGVFGSRTNIKLWNIWIMEETESSFQIVKVSFCQGGDGESQPVRDRGRTLVSIHSDRSDISILVCLTETYCYRLFTLVNAHIPITEHTPDIYISQNSLRRSKSAHCYKPPDMPCFHTDVTMSLKCPINCVHTCHLKLIFGLFKTTEINKQSFLAERGLQLPFLWYFGFVNSSEEPRALQQISAFATLECAQHLAWVHEAREQGGMEMQRIANGTPVL